MSASPCFTSYTKPKGSYTMILLLALLIVLLIFGLGFAIHLLWIVAVIFFLVWLVGLALGRGASAGRHHFYRW
jgi:multisubunit Na+/H+ antiporter MnhG subunit